VKALVFAALLACSSSSGGGFGAQPFTTATSDGGKLSVALYSSPDPIARVSSVELVVTDATSGTPVDGLDVSIEPFMPAMGHGASTQPTLEAKGGGVYIATNVLMVMPGEWQLRTTFAGSVSDTLVTSVDVQ
jgi:hypothetical protein